MTAKLTASPAWQDLLRHSGALSQQSLKDIVLRDSNRLQRFQLKCGAISFSYALQHVTDDTLNRLLALAVQQNVEGWLQRTMRGEKINQTESRAALHMALRKADNTPIYVDGHDVVPDIRAAQQKMLGFAKKVRGDAGQAFSGKPIRHIVNIGIGGSDVGARTVLQALADSLDGPTPHFVANADTSDLLPLLKTLDPAETVFVVVSKTFTTAETMANAAIAKQWAEATLGQEAWRRHFMAVTANDGLAARFGVVAENVFPMWDWVGGRFSLWSSVGLIIAVALGEERFRQLLQGAAFMDMHFATAPLGKNMPVLWALLTIWNRNFMDRQGLAILPYGERLRELPRYVQQMEMESNGKSVDRDGRFVDYKTSPLVFGDRGTVGQHSFHQCLHQGADIIPADFIGIAPDTKDGAGRDVLIANMVAQAVALAFGKQGGKNCEAYAGGRPSNIVMLEALTPYNLGMLLALIEHKVFVEGVIWNINSFDQPGVELGKKLATELSRGDAPTDAEGNVMAELYTSLVVG